MSNPERATMIELTWQDPLSGEEIQQTYDLPVKIGRDAVNTVVIISTAVSREHAHIWLEDDQLMIEDLQSSNGTYVNGQQISRARLQDGGNFMLGNIKISLRLTKSRPRKPTKDYLYGALLQGEAEPTISLSEIKKKNLFADLPTASEQTTRQIDTVPEGEKLSGQALKDFLGGRLQKDIQDDIAPDVSKMAETFGKAKSEANPSLPPTMQPSNKVAERPAPNTVQRVVEGLRRLFGGGT